MPDDPELVDKNVSIDDVRQALIEMSQVIEMTGVRQPISLTGEFQYTAAYGAELLDVVNSRRGEITRAPGATDEQWAQAQKLLDDLAANVKILDQIPGDTLKAINDVMIKEAAMAAPVSMAYRNVMTLSQALGIEVGQDAYYDTNTVSRILDKLGWEEAPTPPEGSQLQFDPEMLAGMARTLGGDPAKQQQFAQIQRNLTMMLNTLHRDQATLDDFRTKNGASFKASEINDGVRKIVAGEQPEQGYFAKALNEQVGWWTQIGNNIAEMGVMIAESANPPITEANVGNALNDLNRLRTEFDLPLIEGDVQYSKERLKETMDALDQWYKDKNIDRDGDGEISDGEQFRAGYIMAQRAKAAPFGGETRSFQEFDAFLERVRGSGLFLNRLLDANDGNAFSAAQVGELVEKVNQDPEAAKINAYTDEKIQSARDEIILLAKARGNNANPDANYQLGAAHMVATRTMPDDARLAKMAERLGEDYTVDDVRRLHENSVMNAVLLDHWFTQQGGAPIKISELGVGPAKPEPKPVEEPKAEEEEPKVEEPKAEEEEPKAETNPEVRQAAQDIVDTYRLTHGIQDAVPTDTEYKPGMANAVVDQLKTLLVSLKLMEEDGKLADVTLNDEQAKFAANRLGIEDPTADDIARVRGLISNAEGNAKLVEDWIVANGNTAVPLSEVGGPAPVQEMRTETRIVPEDGRAYSPEMHRIESAMALLNTSLNAVEGAPEVPMPGTADGYFDPQTAASFTAMVGGLCGMMNIKPPSVDALMEKKGMLQMGLTAFVGSEISKLKGEIESEADAAKKAELQTKLEKMEALKDGGVAQLFKDIEVVQAAKGFDNPVNMVEQKVEVPVNKPAGEEPGEKPDEKEPKSELSEEEKKQEKINSAIETVEDALLKFSNQLGGMIPQTGGGLGDMISGIAGSVVTPLTQADIDDRDANGNRVFGTNSQDMLAKALVMVRTMAGAKDPNGAYGAGDGEELKRAILTKPELQPVRDALGIEGVMNQATYEKYYPQLVAGADTTQRDADRVQIDQAMNLGKLNAFILSLDTLRDEKVLNQQRAEQTTKMNLILDGIGSALSKFAPGFGEWLQDFFTNSEFGQMAAGILTMFGINVNRLWGDKNDKGIEQAAPAVGKAFDSAYNEAKGALPDDATFDQVMDKVKSEMLGKLDNAGWAFDKAMGMIFKGQDEDVIKKTLETALDNAKAAGNPEAAREAFTNTLIEAGKQYQNGQEIDVAQINELLNNATNESKAFAGTPEYEALQKDVKERGLVEEPKKPANPLQSEIDNFVAVAGILKMDVPAEYTAEAGAELLSRMEATENGIANPADLDKLARERMIENLVKATGDSTGKAQALVPNLLKSMEDDIKAARDDGNNSSKYVLAQLAGVLGVGEEFSEANSRDGKTHLNAQEEKILRDALAQRLQEAREQTIEAHRAQELADKYGADAMKQFAMIRGSIETLDKATAKVALKPEPKEPKQEEPKQEEPKNAGAPKEKPAEPVVPREPLTDEERHMMQAAQERVDRLGEAMGLDIAVARGDYQQSMGAELLDKIQQERAGILLELTAAAQDVPAREILLAKMADNLGFKPPNPENIQQMDALLRNMDQNLDIIDRGAGSRDFDTMGPSEDLSRLAKALGAASPSRADLKTALDQAMGDARKQVTPEMIAAQEVVSGENAMARNAALHEMAKRLGHSPVTPNSLKEVANLIDNLGENLEEEEKLAKALGVDINVEEQLRGAYEKLVAEAKSEILGEEIDRQLSEKITKALGTGAPVQDIGQLIAAVKADVATLDKFAAISPASAVQITTQDDLRQRYADYQLVNGHGPAPKDVPVFFTKEGNDSSIFAIVRVKGDGVGDTTAGNDRYVEIEQTNYRGEYGGSITNPDFLKLLKDNYNWETDDNKHLDDKARIEQVIDRVLELKNGEPLAAVFTGVRGELYAGDPTLDAESEHQSSFRLIHGSGSQDPYVCVAEQMQEWDMIPGGADALSTGVRFNNNFRLVG